MSPAVHTAPEVPAVTIYRSKREDGLIEDYRIFIDLAPLFAEG